MTPSLQPCSRPAGSAGGYRHACRNSPNSAASKPMWNASRSHFVIISEMKSRSIAGLEEEIFALGQAQRFMPQAWVLVSDASINAVRNALMRKLGKLDTLFIADATHDKACWFNFGPQNDARVAAPCGSAPPNRRLRSRPETLGGNASHSRHRPRTRGGNSCNLNPASRSRTALAGRTQDHFPSLILLVFRHQGAGADQRIAADAHAVEQYRTHSDQRVVANGGGMHG